MSLETLTVAKPYIILIPVHDDWESLSILLEKLDKVLLKSGISVEVLVVDDGSSQDRKGLLDEKVQYKAITRFDILRLGRNLGHQRAIAVALSYLNENRELQAVVIMDSDGEDDPDDVPRLIAKMNETLCEKIIFAERKKRSEGFVFKFFYALFKIINLILTGISINFGNFSIIPQCLMKRIVNATELWNHYPASVTKAKLPLDTMVTVRKRRYKGQAKMNFVSLVIHGLSAISVFGEVTGVRALIISTLMFCIGLLAILILAWIQTFNDIAIPGCAAYIVVIFTIVLLQASMLSFFFILMILHSRNYSMVIPQRDYQYFISDIDKVFPIENNMGCNE